MADLECEMDRDPPLVILHLRGSLHPSTASRLRSALLKCLADQPTAIVVNGSELTAADDTALTAFIAGARHAAAWPSIPILVAASRQIREGLRRLGIDRHVTLCADIEHAHALVSRRVTPRQVREHLMPTVVAVRTARAVVADTCARWRLPHLAPVAGLLVSELVTNGVCHAGTRMELIVSRTPRHIHLAIRDFSNGRPRLRGPRSESEPGGRGLLLVEALAASWGYTATHDGKVTWASLSVHRPGAG